MTLHSPLADLCTQIRNGQKARLKVISYRASAFCKQVLDVLCNQGYILGYRRAMDGRLHIFLKYYEGEPVIQEIKMISKPGNRRYSSLKRLPQAYQGLGLYILSTSKGVLCDKKARSLGVGGEILCRLF